MTYEDLKQEWESDKDFIVCHTSGSTGTPSKIELPKRLMTESAERTNSFFGIDDASLLYSCISPDYIGGKMMWVRSRVANSRFLFETPSNTPLQNVDPSLKIDLLSVVPSQLQYIVENHESLPSIKTILVGGAPLSPNLKQRVIQSGLTVYESYGMTETSSHIALRKVEEGDTPFKTLNGITVEDFEGRLKINLDADHSFITNDCARILSDSEFFILGRVDNIVNSGGIKINIEALESMISTLDDIPAAFTSIPDEKWGEALVLVIEGGDDEFKLKKDNVSSLLKKHLKPKYFIPIEALPLTQNGKLNRKAIKEFATKYCKIFQ